MRDVGLDGSFSDIQFRRQLGVVLSGGHQTKYVALTVGQQVQLGFARRLGRLAAATAVAAALTSCRRSAWETGRGREETL